MTPSILNKRAASGEGCGGAKVERGERYSMKGDARVAGSMRELGRNLSAYRSEHSTVIRFAKS